MVTDFFKKSFHNGTKILNSKQNTILSAALVLMLAVLGSRILGLIRDRLLAGAFFADNNQWQLDVYFAAFRIPDMIFQLIVMGALSAAFIPVFSNYLKSKEKESWQLVNGVLSWASLAFVILGIFIYFFSYQLCTLLAPNFNQSQIKLMVDLTRIMFVAQFFFMISNFFTGVLQSKQRFLLPALAPILYNIGIILGILFLYKPFGVYGPTFGVIIGSFLHLLIQLPLIKRLGFEFTFNFNYRDSGIRKIVKLMVPRTMGLAVNQIELNVAVMLASAMTVGSLSILNFAEHLYAVPVGLFGLTIGQAALPMLSQEIDDNQGNQKFRSLFISSLKHILYFALPASALVLVLRVPLVRIAFGAKNFPWEATLLTGQVLAIFSLSIAAQAAIQLLVRAFYAMQNTVVPLIIGAVSVLVNVGLSLFFVKILDMEILGLAFAISIASIFQAIVLFILISRLIGGFSFQKEVVPLIKMIFASFLTGIFLWLPMKILDNYILDTTRVIDLVVLTIIASISGFLVYIGFSKILKIEELDQLLATIKKLGSWKKAISQSEEVLVEASDPTLAIGSQD